MTQETNPGLLANCRIGRTKAAGIRWQSAVICIALAIACGTACGTAAAEPNDGVNRAGLATLLRQQTRITFDAVALSFSGYLALEIAAASAGRRLTGVLEAVRIISLILSTEYADTI